jgi:hypothetical protein
VSDGSSPVAKRTKKLREIVTADTDVCWIDPVTLNVRGNERKREREREREKEREREREREKLGAIRAGDCRYRDPAYADIYYPSIGYLLAGKNTFQKLRAADKSSIIVPVTVEPVALTVLQ